MICEPNNSTSEGSYILEEGPVLDRYRDVIYLVHSHTIRAPPRAFMHSLVGKYGATYHQPVPLAAVNKSCSIVVSAAEFVISNHTATSFDKATYLGIHISH